MTKPRLTLSPDEMRRAGYAVIDRLVEHMETLETQSPWGEGEAPDDGAFKGPPPREGRSPEAVLNYLNEHLFPYSLRVNHPRFYSFVPGPSNFIGVLGDALASGFNIFGGTWIGSSGGAEIERTAIKWMRGALGMDEDAGGLFTSGGSMANVIGLAAARHVKLKGDMTGARIYASEQTHSSVERGLRLLGFGLDQFHKLPSDADFRLDPAVLAQAIAEDRAAGFRPFCVVVNAGTTNTGAVDPFVEVANLCDREDLWLHADGAYGACSAFCDRGRAALEGVERVDSISFDPHKWLFQPFEIGGLMVKDAASLRDAFDIRPEYLRDTVVHGRGINFYEYGPQLTRSLRALKLWMTFHVFGADKIAAGIDNGFLMAEAAQEILEKTPGWRLISAASMAVVSFRAAPEGMSDEACDQLNSDIAARSRDEGQDVVLTTILKGRIALRLCTINPRLTKSDIEATLGRLDGHFRSLIAA